MKKLFTLLAALLFLGGLMAQESNYYLYLSERSWDDGDRFNLEWNADDEDYQLDKDFDPGIYEFMIVTLDGGDPTFALGYSNVDLEASCAGIREGENGKIKVIITSWYAGLKIHVNAEGNSVVIECVNNCENIITADYVLLFLKVNDEGDGWDWDHENAVFIENNTASVTKPAGTYQFAVVPTVEYFGDNGWNQKLGSGNVEGDCSSPYYREGEEGSIKVTLAEEGDISVTVNGSSLCVEGNFVGPDYYIVGSFCDWDLDQAEPMYDNTYTDYLAVGTHEFKVVTPAIISGEDTNWTSALGYSALDPECSSENIQEGTNGNFKVTISESGSNEVTVQYMAGYVCVTGEFVIPETPATPTHYLVGSFCNWSLANALPMNNGTITTTLDAGTYSFKVVPAVNGAATSWDGNLGYSALDIECSDENIEADGENVKVTLAERGDVTVSVVAGYLCIRGNFVIPSATTITSWTVAGEEAITGAEWNKDLAANNMTVSDGTWTLIKEDMVITELRDYNYKVVANHDYSVGQYPASGNQKLTIDKRGTYTITYTWVPATSTLTAVATWMGWPTDIENADATTVRKLIENGQLVIIRDGKRYNAQGILVE